MVGILLYQKHVNVSHSHLKKNIYYLAYEAADMMDFLIFILQLIQDKVVAVTKVCQTYQMASWLGFLFLREPMSHKI